jgi:hypothetical protein
MTKWPGALWFPSLNFRSAKTGRNGDSDSHVKTGGQQLIRHTPPMMVRTRTAS